MKIVNRGTIECKRCGCRLYDYVEFENGRGGIDGDITKEYTPYSGELCMDCVNEIEFEEEEKED